MSGFVGLYLPLDSTTELALVVVVGTQVSWSLGHEQQEGELGLDPRS